MIYGSINFLETSSQSGFLLQNVGDVINWNECIQEIFYLDAFLGIFLTDKKGIFNREDVYFTNESLIIFIDGFIYNQEELSLKILNNPKNAIKVPELIANAYLKWGESFAAQLNGDFAICIYNKHTKQALFVVDQIGIRPLAVSIVGSTVYFATDVLGLSKALFKNQKIDKDYLINIFLMAGQNFLLSPHKSIVRLKPGHYYNFSQEHQEMVPYWFPEKIKTNNSLTAKQVIDDLRLLVTDSVKIRADQRFSASAHVSGGLDSSIVAAVARKVYKNQETFYGFSWSPQSLEVANKKVSDERLRVIEICRQNNITPIFSNFDLADFLSFVSEWKYPSELVFEKKIVEAAKNNNISLIFSGWGGDEFISIANRGIDADLLKALDWKHFLKKFPFWKLKKCASAIRWEIKYLYARTKYSKYKAELAVFPYINADLKNNRIPRVKRFHHRSRREVHLQLINLNHIAARTADWYVYGQLNGIEYRYPLLDVRIVEYMLKVPSKLLVNGYNDRKIFRELGKGFFTDELLVRLSKFDPVKNEQYTSLANYGNEQFMYEFLTFRKNPDLNFVDFVKLEKDLPKMSAVPTKDKPIAADVFFYLKKAHEFTRGYHS
jgi:asparagine synthase (glutamine-hydrolysing)